MNKQYSLLKVRIYPSLDFTLGTSAPPKPDNTSCSTQITEDVYRDGIFEKKIQTVATNERVNQQEISRKHGGNLGPEKITALLEAQEGRYLECVENGDIQGSQAAIDAIERLSVAPSLMGLSVASISHKPPRKQRGLGGITPYGKRLVRSGLAILEREHGRECLTLGTCTLPALSPDEFEVICSNWSEVVRQFFQEVGRELERRSLPADYVQVTEIQEKRFNSSGDVGLHLHWVIPGRANRYADWAFKPAEIKALWQRILSNQIGRDPDCEASTRIEKPRTSLAQELGKYLSKGVDVIKAVVKCGKAHLLPSAWWGASKVLKSEVKSAIVEINGPVAIWIDRNLKALKSEGKLWYVDIWVENDGREFRAGAVGRFNTQEECDLLIEFRDVCESCEDISEIALIS